MEHNMLILKDVPFLIQKALIANKELTTLTDVLDFIKQSHVNMYKTKLDNVKDANVNDGFFSMQSHTSIKLDYKAFTFDCKRGLVKEFLSDIISHFEFETSYFVSDYYINTERYMNSRLETISGGFKVLTFCTSLDLKLNKDNNLPCDIVIALPTNDIDEEGLCPIHVLGHIARRSSMEQRYDTYYAETKTSKSTSAIKGF